jgi:hypothetical protein
VNCFIRSGTRRPIAPSSSLPRTLPSSLTSTPGGSSAGWPSSPSWATIFGQHPTGRCRLSLRRASLPVWTCTTASPSHPAFLVRWPSFGTFMRRSWSWASTTAFARSPAVKRREGPVGPTTPSATPTAPRVSALPARWLGVVQENFPICGLPERWQDRNTDPERNVP